MSLRLAKAIDLRGRIHIGGKAGIFTTEAVATEAIFHFFDLGYAGDAVAPEVGIDFPNRYGGRPCVGAFFTELNGDDLVGGSVGGRGNVEPDFFKLFVGPSGDVIVDSFYGCAPCH